MRLKATRQTERREEKSRRQGGAEEERNQLLADCKLILLRTLLRTLLICLIAVWGGML